MFGDDDQKYLEIEIYAMPRYDLARPSNSNNEKQQVIWDGFVIPPTHGTVAVNQIIEADDDDEEDEEKKEQHEESESIRTGTHLQSPSVKKMATQYFDSDEKDTHCDGCFVVLKKAKWQQEKKKYYCDRCVKFRVYQECVRKFVLEYENEETRDDLWPWYENCKNEKELKQYKGVLHLYIDQVLAIGNIRDSNLKCSLSREETQNALDAASAKSPRCWVA